jgi:uncharacterized UPF0160 family protein
MHNKQLNQNIDKMIPMYISIRTYIQSCYTNEALNDVPDSDSILYNQFVRYCYRTMNEENSFVDAIKGFRNDISNVDFYEFRLKNGEAADREFDFLLNQVDSAIENSQRCMNRCSYLYERARKEQREERNSIV